MKTNCIRLFVLAFAFAAFGAMSMAPSVGHGANVTADPNAGNTYNDGYDDGYNYGYEAGKSSADTGTGTSSGCCGQQPSNNSSE